MANSPSAKKRARQNEVRRLKNRSNSSRLKTQEKKLLTLIKEGDQTAAQAELAKTVRMIDRSIQKGVLHENTAARKKSRLTLAVNRLA